MSSLKYFVDTVTVNSLTTAAEINFVSRPAISQAIRRLEAHLGYALLEHKKKRFTLTQHGLAFYQKATVALKTFNEALDSTTSQNSLRLACSATLAEFFVLPFLKKRKLRPNINIRIGTSAKVRQLIQSGESAIGLLIDDELTYGFECTVIRKGHFGFQSPSGRLESPLLTTENRPEVVAALKALDSPQPRLQIESWSLCHKTAQTMGGTCLVPDLFPIGPLKKVPIKSYSFEYKLIAITKNKNHLSEIERAFFDRIQC